MSDPGAEQGMDVDFSTTAPLPQHPDAAEAELLAKQGNLPPPTADFASALVGKDYKKKHKLVGDWFWFRCECGLVMSAVSSWELVVKQHGITTGGYMCRHCQGKWKAGRGGTRMVQIGNGKEKIQLILDEPPEAMYNKWCNDRIEFYKRIEPNAPLRDVKPEATAALCRLRFRGLASDAVWSVILSNPEQSTLAAITNLGRKHELSRS